jgi:NitT/TauT family transport system permease protein
MKGKTVPVLVVLGIIVVIWYVCTVWMNSAWVYDQAGREGRTVGFGELVTATMALERPMLPAPHQVAVALWDGIAGQAVTSKRSLVYHGWVTMEATLAGFALGIVLGVSLAVGIVYFRVMEATVMPWAVISQTIPIVALAPMIVVLSNTLSLGEALGVENRLVSKTIISAYLELFSGAGGHGEGVAVPGCDADGSVGDVECERVAEFQIPALAVVDALFLCQSEGRDCGGAGGRDCR